jgi:drug/metabolite transporter (DMT)-like permease
MATRKATALTALMTGIVCVILVGSGWLSDPLAAADQTAALSKLLAWSCLGAAAIAVIVAIYFTFRALTIREPPKESDSGFEGDDSGERPGPNGFSND